MTTDNPKQEKPLEWKPHDFPFYDETLKTRCAAEVQRLVAADSEARLKFITDPREVHGRLYASLTPASHPEYAGTYRGTTGTTLEHRRIGTLRDDDQSFQEFISPDRVTHWLNEVARQAKKIFGLPRATPPGIVLSEIVRLFYIFGLVHPFLDGNGHIQRLIFSACVLERDSLYLINTWTIHPRPYDIEIKRAFEASTMEARLADLNKVLSVYVSN